MNFKTRNYSIFHIAKYTGPIPPLLDNMVLSGDLLQHYGWHPKSARLEGPTIQSLAT